MAKVSLFICSFFYFGFIIVQSQHSLDDVLLKFRKDYVDYKTKSIKSLDDLFFDVYTALDRNIDSSVNSYSKYNGTWGRICANISKTLDSSATKRAQDTCSSMQSTIDLASSTASRTMVSFYFGKLGSSCEFVDLAEDIFSDVEENMDHIPAMYNNNPICVKPMLTKHRRTYSPFIDDINSFGRKSLDKMKTIFKSALKASEKAATSLSTTANSFNKCLKNSDSSKCVKDLAKQKTDCIACQNLNDIMMDPIKLVLDAVAAFNKFFFSEVPTAQSFSLKVIGNLTAWTQQARTCNNKTINGTKGIDPRMQES